MCVGIKFPAETVFDSPNSIITMDSLNSACKRMTTKNGGESKAPNKSFQNMSFFLDKKNPPQLNATLTEKIQKLGAKIDPFITKDTDCVITSRPKTEWNQPSAKIENVSPTPILFLNNVNGFSRGKMLLEKSGHSYKTMDTLELAKHFKISIIRSAKAMKFLDECLEKRANNPNQTTNNVKQQSSDDSVRKLLPPFIKVVDNSCKYRPNFKELKEWPTLNFEFRPELCPFFKARNMVAADNNGSSHQPQPHLKISQESNKTTNNCLKPCAQLTTPILTTTTTTPNVNNKSITVNQNKNLRRRNLTYCEICRRDFLDFEAHLKDEKHSNFLADDENYQELIGVINSLPPFERMNQETQTNEITVGSSTFNNHPKSQTLHNQTNCLDNNAKFKTQSSPMTSVQLTNSFSSNSKFTFVAIHDLDMCDENNPNTNNLPESA